MQRYLKIVTMDGQLAPLSCNIAQLKVHNSLERQRKAGFPQRAIVLKARREGVSTYTEGRCFYEINVKPMRHACICSADLDASNKVFKMAQTFQNKMPDEQRRPTQYSNRKEIIYADPHMSSFVVQTAGKDVLGRGGLTHYLHCTEFAFWKDAQNQLGGAVQEVPDDVDTLVVLESTANGTQGAFYEMFTQAYDDYMASGSLANYLPIFLPWYIFPAYRMPSDNLQVGKAHDAGYEQEWLDAEHDLVGELGITPEQLMWRRWAIKNKCQNDLSLFKQEYPATVEEAFQSTGRPVFFARIINRQTQFAKEGPRVIFDEECKPHEVFKSIDSWTIIKHPKPDHQYAIGVDTMTGKLSDTQDVKSERDFHGVSVLDRDTKEYVAFFWGQCIQDELAQQVIRCGRYYNDAYIAPELPNGMQVLVRLKESGYTNIFQRQQAEEREFVDDTENLGWKTTPSTRPLMVEAFKSFMEEPEVRLYHKPLIGEMKNFIYNKEGKPIHADRKHDDLLFASMIALQVHLHSPFRAIPYPYSTTGEVVARKTVDLSQAGVIDPGPWAMEDDWITFTD